MRARHAAAGAHLADRLTGGDVLRDAGVDPARVRVKRQQARAVVENERAVGIVSIRDLAEWSIRTETAQT